LEISASLGDRCIFWGYVHLLGISAFLGDR
jgi:hypothetical protein